MRSLKPWVDALNIDRSAYTSWTAEIPRHENVTFWCLERGKIRSIDYFQWAVNHYELPMVNADYFKLPANRELWTKIQSVANWSPELLPLEEWDGTIYVACVEPPEDIRWSFPVQYVLATARDLRFHWERLMAEPTQVSTTFNSISLKIPVSSNTNPVIANAVGATPPTPEELDEPTNPGIEIDAPPPVEEPIGLNLNLSAKGILKLDSLGSPSPKPIAPPVVAPTPTPTPAPAAVQTPKLVLNIPTATADKTTPPETTSLKDEVTGVGFVMAQSSEPVQKPASSASSKEGAIDADRIAPQSLNAAQSESEAIAWAFQQLKQHFKFTWLLFVQGEKLVPYRWDALIQAKKENAFAPIDLNQPSLFRIVTRTRMPYHGHVVDSPINTDFFRNWGLRQTPPHVTAVPIVNNGHLIAVLITAGDKPAQMDQALRFTEKIAVQIFPYFGKKQAA